MASLDDFIGIEMLLEMMDGLLGSVVPAGIDPFFSLRVLPGPIQLGYNGFRRIVWILKMNPVANSPDLVLVCNTIRQW